MRQKKLSSTGWLFYITSFSLSWCIVLISLFFASIDNFSTTGVNIDMPVKSVDVETETLGLNAKQYPGAVLENRAPLIVISPKNVFVIKVEDFRIGLEKNATRFPYQVIDDELIERIRKNLAQSFNASELKTVLVLPSKEFKVSQLVVFTEKVKRIQSIDHIVLSSNSI